MTQQLTREQILATIVPKSDQFNYDDLIGGPITVTVAGVSAGAPDQPVNIRLQGETRFYRPCKTMRRVLIMLWGDDGHKWIGRSMTLYGEPNVMFGGVKVGGIRISHMSDISETMMLQLTMTRGKKAPYKVMPLRAADVLSIGADRARDVTPQEPPKEVDPLMLVAPGAAMEKEIEAEMKEHPPHEHDEQDPAADDSPSSGADSRGTNDGVPPPVAPGDLYVPTKDRSFGEWIAAMEDLISAAEAPDAAWAANIDTYNKMVQSAKTTETQHGKLAALKDHWRARVDAVRLADLAGA